MEKSEISVVMGDITKIKADCIVNAANKTLLGGGGVDGAIHRAAGSELLQECLTLNGCETGEAKITKGYRLPSLYVIHTVGPIYSADEKDSENLASCYTNSLTLAREHNIKSIAFPSISTGVYGYPLRDAALVAVRAVRKWIEENKDYCIKIIFCAFSEENYEIYKDILK